MTDLSIEYIAGFFDGEGCVGIYPGKLSKNSRVRTGYRHYFISVSIGQVDPRVLMHLKQRFGGVLYFHNRSQKNPRRQDAYFWLIKTRQAAAFLRTIQPFCIVKRTQIDVALEFAGKQVKQGGRYTKGVTHPGPEYAERIKALKKYQVESTDGLGGIKSYVTVN